MVCIDKRSGQIVATEDWNGFWGVLKSALANGNMLATEQEFFGIDGEHIKLSINSEHGEFVVEQLECGEVVYAEVSENYWKAFKDSLLLSDLYGDLADDFFRKVGV